MQYFEIVADKLSAGGWTWVIAAPLPEMASGGLLTRIARRYSAGNSCPRARGTVGQRPIGLDLLDTPPEETFIALRRG